MTMSQKITQFCMIVFLKKSQDKALQKLQWTKYSHYGECYGMTCSQVDYWHFTM